MHCEIVTRRMSARAVSASMRTSAERTRQACEKRGGPIPSRPADIIGETRPGDRDDSHARNAMLTGHCQARSSVSQLTLVPV